jgi:hypothetical protein
MMEDVIAMEDMEEEQEEVLKAMEMLGIASSHSVDPSSHTDSTVTFLDDPVGEFYIPRFILTDDEEDLDMDDVSDSSSFC